MRPITKLDLEIAHLKHSLGIPLSQSQNWITHKKSPFPQTLNQDQLQKLIWERLFAKLKKKLHKVETSLRQTVRRLKAIEILRMKKKSVPYDQFKDISNEIVSRYLLVDRVTKILMEKYPELNSFLTAEYLKDGADLDPLSEFFVSNKTIHTFLSNALSEINSYMEYLVKDTFEGHQDNEESSSEQSDLSKSKNVDKYALADKIKSSVIHKNSKKSAEPNHTRREESEGNIRKKNRPGQRARREIWERMHGNNANHLQQQQQLINKRKQLRQQPTEQLHPSWQAKKQQSKVVQFSGTKLSFDSDNES